jgi:predicted TIM-barrel fold metal-dependent hydrolase
VAWVSIIPGSLCGYGGINRAFRLQRGQIYFGFEVDEKLLPFAIEEFGDQCWVYGSDIPHGDRLYGAVDVFLKRNDISEESKRKLLVDNTARFYGL